jgi:hypothetical protein
MRVEEHAEHAEHVAHGIEHGNKRAALLIAVLAAVLAVCEQQAKRADIAVEENAVSAADTWNEYQAKSVRSAISRDLERFGATLDVPATPALATARQDLLRQLRDDQDHYDKDKVTGRDALAARARAFEEKRERSLERAHTYDNAAASLELGIVLATASVITSAVLLLRVAYAMGAIGVLLGIAGALAPSLVVF